MKIKRHKFSELCANLAKPEIQILLGARQVGKSTLLQDLRQESLTYYHEARSFNLEFPDDLLFFSRPDKEIFTDLSQKPNTIFFIDEFHYLKNASHLFKGLYDLKKNIKIVASGSSSLEIHKHLKESLAGRRNIFKIFPLCFKEWQQTQGEVEQYLTYGGMPGLIHLKERNEKIEYLSQMVQTYIMRDVKGLIKEENVRAFNHLLHFLAENQGNIISTSSLSNEIGVTNKTVESYLEILEQTFVLYGLHSFSQKLSNELKKSRKYYFYDLGIRNSLIKNFAPLSERSDIGVIFETWVMLELKIKQRANVELRFWRTKQGEEVDFVWIEDKKPIPLEVKTTYKNDSPPKGLMKFLRTYSTAPFGYVLTKDRSEDQTYEGKLIKYRSIDQIEF